MGKTEGLSRKQLAVLDDLFADEMGERRVLQKHEVTSAEYAKWLADEGFVTEFDRRKRHAVRQGELVVARYTAIAAMKLVALTASENQETARKACLDIMELSRNASQPAASRPGDQSLPPISPELASRLLAALAASNESPGASDE